MKKVLTLVSIISLIQLVKAQSANEIIQQVLAAQQKINTITYTLQRSDTFVTGQTRITAGQVKMKIAPADTMFGCWFWGKRDDVNSETIYDGRGMEINHKDKNYNSSVYLPGLLGSPGGQMVVPDFAKLDTNKNTGFALSQDDAFYYLTKYLPDIKEYDVTNRNTVYTIEKKSMLPVNMRSHQETLGKVQDLNYSIKDMWVNDAAKTFDFSAIRFPADYNAVTFNDGDKKMNELKGKPAPVFELTSFTNKITNLQKLKGKPVLLDFWEVWCGPCVASMPKVQVLYDKYKERGLQVYGVMTEKAQMDPAKKLLDKKNITFPILLGNESTLKDYSVDAIPAYFLIDKKGKISFVSTGFSEEMEGEILKLLKE